MKMGVKLLNKWFMLVFVSLSCVTIWGLVIWSIINFNNDHYAKIPEYNIVNEEVLVSTTEPIENKPEFFTNTSIKVSIKEYGIRKEDVKHIAPNGIISIDELLTIVTNGDQQ